MRTTGSSISWSDNGQRIPLLSSCDTDNISMVSFPFEPVPHARVCTKDRSCNEMKWPVCDEKTAISLHALSRCRSILVIQLEKRQVEQREKRLPRPIVENTPSGSRFFCFWSVENNQDHRLVDVAVWGKIGVDDCENYGWLSRWEEKKDHDDRK